MGIFDLFRRKKVYERVPTPESQKELKAAIDKLVAGLGGGAAMRLVQFSTDRPIAAEGIKPPDDPSTEGWSWEAWQKEMAALAFPGWSPCRFAHRTTPHDGGDRARFVFGITSSAFGIWKQPFEVCSVDAIGEYQRSSKILACLTHLPSGMGLGIFKGPDAAALAADTMIRACPQMADVAYDATKGSPWSTLIERSVSAWKAIGIEPSADSHAHDPSTGSGPYFIMGLTLEDGKPERLS